MSSARPRRGDDFRRPTSGSRGARGGRSQRCVTSVPTVANRLGPSPAVDTSQGRAPASATARRPSGRPAPVGSTPRQHRETRALTRFGNSDEDLINDATDVRNPGGDRRNHVATRRTAGLGAASGLAGGPPNRGWGFRGGTAAAARGADGAGASAQAGRDPGPAVGPSGPFDCRFGGDAAAAQ